MAPPSPSGAGSYCKTSKTAPLSESDKAGPPFTADVPCPSCVSALLSSRIFLRLSSCIFLRLSSAYSCDFRRAYSCDFTPRIFSRLYLSSTRMSVPGKVLDRSIAAKHSVESQLFLKLEHVTLASSLLRISVVPFGVRIHRLWWPAPFCLQMPLVRLQRLFLS